MKNTEPLKLVCIRRIDGRYFLWMPPWAVRMPLAVEGNRLVEHDYQNGHESHRSVLWARRGGKLVLADCMPGDAGLQRIATFTFKKAAGSDAQLAAELHGRRPRQPFRRTSRS
jgi:hypothetical protein